MIDEQFYLSEKDGIAKVIWYTNLSEDEVEIIVGRFSKRSSRAGKLRGEVLVYASGEVVIRHHFTKKVLWRS